MDVTEIANCLSFVCIDIETTGFRTKSDEIIEIAAVRVENFETVDRFNTFINPHIPIPLHIQKLTKITDNDVKNAPDIADVFDDFMSFIDGAVLVGHNIQNFDLPMLNRYAADLGCSIENDVIDTCTLSRQLLPAFHSHSLETLCNSFDIINNGAHRAINDVEANIEVYKKLISDIDTSVIECKTKKKNIHFRESSKITKRINEFLGIITGVTCDNILNENEVFFLKSWLDKNSDLKDTYPFDVAIHEISVALADGVLEQSELDNLLEIFKEFLNPIKSEPPQSEAIDFLGKTVCLTGDFITGSKDEIGERLKELGATISKSVVRRVDYLIVGEKGSEAWSCGNYGNKIKIALEMQNKGHHIKILKECEVFQEVQV